VKSNHDTLAAGRFLPEPDRAQMPQSSSRQVEAIKVALRYQPLRVGQKLPKHD